MPEDITIRSVGLVDQDILEHIAQRISRLLGLSCRVLQGMDEIEYAYNEAKCQYNSKVILKRMLHNSQADTFRLLSVTNKDLYVPALKYVYGSAQIEGRCAIISLHRLCPSFYDQPFDVEILKSRSEKTALHELGHTFGLTHCRNRKCVMFSSTRIEDTDSKQSDYCPTCFKLFKCHLEKLSL